MATVAGDVTAAAPTMLSSGPARWARRLVVVVPFAVLWATAVVAPGLMPDRLVVLTEEQAVPFRDWANSFLDFLRTNEFLFGWSVRDLSRAISGVLEWPLTLSENLLTASWGLPWILVVALFGVVGHWIGGRNTALLGVGSMLYLAAFGLWEDAMITLSIVFVCAPLAALFGWMLGLWGAKSLRFESVLSPTLNVMQSLPHFSYLVPIAVFVGIGDEAGAIATILFAIPPMARLTMLGLRTVPAEIIEAGAMAGSTPRQMLWKVEMPAARPALMVGLNQVIMQCFGMTVLASFVGTRGLGLPLLNFLNATRIGDALQYGLAIVVMAIVLDRLTQAVAERKPEHRPEGLTLLQAHPHAAVAVGLAVVSFALAPILDAVRTVPEAMIVDTSDTWDSLVRWITVEFRGPLEGLRDFLILRILIPLKETFLSIPWIALVALAAAIGWRLGRLRLALTAGGLVAFLALAGYWTESMETLYLAFAALVISMVIGIPLGVFASYGPTRSRIMKLLLDTFQVLPSFIYLIPVVMLFRVGPVAGLFAILVYSTIPAIRYTMLGMQNVPEDLIEAGRTSGCTEAQLLRKIRFPVAFPEIMLGVNQTLMFGLLLVIIAAFIGGIEGLGDEILRARTEPRDVGEGLVAGFCVAAMGLAVDQLVTSYARTRKAQLGLD